MYNPTPYRDTEDHASRHEGGSQHSPRSSIDSTSTTSLILERLNRDNSDDIDYDPSVPNHRGKESEGMDLESGMPHLKPVEKKVRRAVYIVGILMVGAWLLALVIYISREHYRLIETPYDPAATAKAGKKITLDQVMGGSWRSSKHEIKWIDGPAGTEDGLLLTQNAPGSSNFLEVQDVANSSNTIVLMQSRSLQGIGQPIQVSKVWPSSDLKKVLVASDIQTVWLPCTVYPPIVTRSSHSLYLGIDLELASFLHCQILDI